MMHRTGGFGLLETKFRSFDGELALKDGAEIAGYASLFGAADQGGDVVQQGAYRRLAGAAAKARGGGEDAVAARSRAADRRLGRGARGRPRALRQGPAAARGAGGARGARAAAGGRHRRAVDRLSHAAGARRPRAAGGSCTRSSSGRCRWSPSRCSPRRGCRPMPPTRRKLDPAWRGPWRRASARPGRCWRERAPARVAAIKESHR